MAVHEKLTRGTRNDSIVGKLETAMDEVSKLLTSVQKKFQEIDGLIKELKALKVLKVVLKFSGTRTAFHDDRAYQRPTAHAANHGNLRDSGQEEEDERYEGMGEVGGGEDNGQHDK